MTVERQQYVYQNPDLHGLDQFEVLRPQDAEYNNERINPHFFSEKIQELTRDALLEKYAGVLSQQQVELVANPNDPAKVTRTAHVLTESIKHNIPYFITRIPSSANSHAKTKWDIVGVGKVGYVSRPIYNRMARLETFSQRSHAKLNELYVPKLSAQDGESLHPTIELATFHAMLKTYSDSELSAVWYETPHDAPQMIDKLAKLGFYATGMARLSRDFGTPLKEEQFNGLSVAAIITMLEANHPWLAKRQPVNN